jgi:hypothetical protein
MTIMGVITAGAFTMFTSGFQMTFRTQAKLEVNSYIRKATNRMVFDGRRASYFRIYDRFDRTNLIIPPATTPVLVNFRETAYHGKGYRKAGESGSCLVLVYNGVNPEPFNPASKTPIERVVVYTLDTDTISPNGVYRLRTFDLRIDPSNTTLSLAPLETLIPAAVTGAQPASNLDVCIPLARGMLNGHLFHNLDGKSILFNAHFFYGDPTHDYGDAGVKSATNTYSFTITPRGSV